MSGSSVHGVIGHCPEEPQRVVVARDEEFKPSGKCLACLT